MHYTNEETALVSAVLGETDTSSSSDLPYSLDPTPNPQEVSGENLAWKCLEHWNASVGVDEGKTSL